MFPMLLLPFIFIFIVPVGLTGVLLFRRQHGCDTCTATHYWCARREAGKSCPFFE